MTDAHGVARDQLRAFIERIERLEEEKKTIADDIKDVYGEAKGMGYIPAMIKKVIALRKKDDQERMEEELILDTYLAALGMIEAPFEQDDEPVAADPTRSPAKPLQAPRAATTVSARVAINQPETATKQRVNGHSQHEGANARATVRNEVVTVVGTESGTVANFKTCERCQGNGEIVTDWDRYRHPHEGDVGDEAVAECPDCGGEGINDRLTNPEIAPASHGEAEAPSVESVKPNGEPRSSDANIGGDHDRTVATEHNAATHQAGASFKAPATFSLRPDCRNPGETCAGHGTTLCHSCKVAMREREVT